MLLRTVAVLGFALAELVLVGCATPHAITTHTLLAEMTDLTNLAEFPEPAYTCRQSSSYDRKSTTPADAETWFANDDYNQFLRVEEREGWKEWVMLDADGPGVIVRIWSANPKGNIRIYLDHSDQPVITAPMNDYLCGKVAGFPEPIAHERSKGWNSYFPIPYARHCKVTSDSDGFYYHVNYRTYSTGTKVVSYSPDDNATLRTEIERAAAGLQNPTGTDLVPQTWAAESVGPADVLKRVLPSGSHAIVGLVARIEAEDREVALRHLLLTIECDGQTTVACPLGDFFGAGPGAHTYESLPLGIDKDGTMWCHWVMPYRRSACVTIRNNSPASSIRVGLHVQTQPREWTSQTMYFHAGWAVERDYPTRPFSDWNYVTVHGKGVYVGSAFTIANPVKAWWGEGDEKIYVDNEKFPSHFGTGTEDYYGYAWCWPVPFSHAFHNQPQCDGPGNYGRTAVNRWHLLDRIPFTHDLRFDMELWHWWEGRVPELSVVSYWYARRGETDNRQPPDPEKMTLARVPPYEVPRVAGAIEGEDMRIVAKTGTVEPQEIDRCSGEKHLWWHDGQPGDKLVLAFATARSGNYRVFGRFVKAKDYGIVRISINAQPVAQTLDLYHDGVLAADEVALGVFSLQAGDNSLAVEITGTNDQAVPKYMFGLDYLRLEPAD